MRQLYAIFFCLEKYLTWKVRIPRVVKLCVFKMHHRHIIWQGKLVTIS